MSELFKAVEARYTAFKKERARKFDKKREIFSSNNLFLLMKDIHSQKISGRKVDELGNTAEASAIDEAILRVEQPTPVGENLCIKTILTWNKTLYEKDFIGTYVSVGHKGKGTRISSLSKFEIIKDPDTKKGSDKLIYNLVYYDSNDDSLGLTGHMDILKPELFPKVVGRAYEIAFNLFERKGEQKPLSPLATEMTPFSSGEPKKIRR